MSESAGKTFRGLQEAYASIYANNSENLTEETIVSEVQEEEFVDPEVLVDIVVEQLINNGYVKTEDQAINIIPHIGDSWLDNIIETFIVEQHFIGAVNLLVSEGVDLSEYTFEELAENYFEAYGENYSILSEQLAGDMPGLGLLRGLTGIFGAGAASRAVQTKPRPYRTRPEGSAVDYGQMTLEKPKPTTVVKTDTSPTEPAKPAITPRQAKDSQPGTSDKRSRAVETLKQRQAARQQAEAEAQAKREKLRTTREKLQHPKSKTTTQQSAQQSSSSAPQGPNGPKKPNQFMDALKKAGKEFGIGTKPTLKTALRALGGGSVLTGIGLGVDELTTKGAGRWALGQMLGQGRKLGPWLRGKSDFENW